MTRRNQTEPDTSPLYELSMKQELAIDLILQGKTDVEVADAVGSSRSTVNLWRNRHPRFVAELNRRRSALAATRQAQLESLLDELLTATKELLESRDPATTVALAKLLFPQIVAGCSPVGPTDAGDVIRADAGSSVENLLADLSSSSADLERAEKRLLKELTAAEENLVE